MKYYNRSNFEKEKMNIVAELQEMESDKVTDYMVLLKSVYTEAQIGEIIAAFHKAVTNERR
jgi:hypothetical protein